MAIITMATEHLICQKEGDRLGLTLSCQKCINMYSIFSEEFVEVQWPCAIEKMVAKVVAMAND